jgi:hypothetical protein
MLAGRDRKGNTQCVVVNNNFLYEVIQHNLHSCTVILKCFDGIPVLSAVQSSGALSCRAEVPV